MQIAQSYFEGNGVLIAIVHREIENDENPNAPTVVHDERLLPIQSLQQLKDVKSEIGAREKVEIAIINTCEYTVRGIKPPRKKRNSAKHHEEI